jgi:hypothetical protein
MSDEEVRILDELTPADVGLDTVGNKIIRFEGFTDECWAAAFEEGKTADDLEEEIISDWAMSEETTGLTRQECGWWTPDIFYAVYYD